MIYARSFSFTPTGCLPPPKCTRAAPWMAARFCRLQQNSGTPSEGKPPMPPPLPPSACKVQTPLAVEEWSIRLGSHPDQDWVKQILHGLKEGVRIGLSSGSVITSATVNLKSAAEHPGIVDKYLSDELSDGNLASPYPPPASMA